jgi:hypothetical protein
MFGQKLIAADGIKGETKTRAVFATLRRADDKTVGALLKKL